MFAEVITDISNYNVNKSFYYKIPNELKNKNIIGFRVEVPFGMRIVQGYVIDTFAKVTDYLLDNFVSDIYVQSKINNASQQVDDAIYETEKILNVLKNAQ